MSCRVQIIGDAEKAASFVSWARKQWTNMESGHKTWHLDGVTIEVIRSGESGIVRIMSELGSGFIFHPRSSIILLMTHYRHYLDYSLGFGIYLQEPVKTNYGVVGGWSNGDTELSQSYLFPLVDGDNASMLLSDKDDEEVTVAFEQPGMYGNHYWTNGDEGGFETISWKGPPTRHGSIHHEYQIPGLSIVENTLTTLTDEIPQFTVFSPNLYRLGEVVAQAPSFSWYQGGTDTGGRSLILGAMQSATGVTFIVTQNDHQNAPAFIWLFSNGEVRSGETEGVATDYLASVNNVTPAPDPYVSVVKKLELTNPGYFLGIWCDRFSDGAAFRADGWELIAEFPYTRNRRAWFGNVSGTAFVCSNGDAVVLTTLGSAFTASYTAHEVEAGAFNEELETDIRADVAYSISCNPYQQLFEYKGVGKEAAIVSLSFSSTTTTFGGLWGEPTLSGGASCQPYSRFDHYITKYYEKSYDTYGVHEYCYIQLPYYEYTQEELNTLPKVPANTTLQACDVTEGAERPCIGVDWLNQPLNKGVIKTIRSQGWLTTWEGDFPGQEHTVDTDFSVNVCGVTIPMVKTTRRWKDEKQVYTGQVHHEAGMFFQNVSEVCTIEKSTIHFVDQRYGMCLYKTTKDVIEMECHLDDVAYIVAYGSTQLYNVAAIKKDDYTATSTETWHLVVDGVDTIVATAELELIPFGEPLGTNSEYPGYVRLLSFPKPPGAAFGSPPEGTILADLGCYEDGYDQIDGEQRQADGGMDHFYPEWCRSLEADPFWAAAAANRFWFTFPGEDMEPRGAMPYTPPEVTVEPMPVGSFARHPILGDMYQFLIHQFNGTNIVVSSANINSFIDEQLALAKNEDGTSKNLATHDTTLYYPISLA